MKIIIKGLYTFLVSMTVATLLGYLFKELGFPETNIVIVYLLAIQVITWLNEHFVVGILSSIGATLTFNYFFTAPFLTLSVQDPSYIITFIIMTLSSVLTSTLTTHVKKNAEIARARERETLVLYNLTSQLTDAMDEKSITNIVIQNLNGFLSRGIGLIICSVDGTLDHHFVYQDSQLHLIREVEGYHLLTKQLKDLKASHFENEEFIDYPIKGRTGVLGVLRIHKNESLSLNQKEHVLILSLIESTALALERIRITEQRIIDREQANQERYRSTLLRSISHDLRTPLSSILGNSENLIQMSEAFKSEILTNTLIGIHDEADWLYHMVENILSLTKLQEGKLAARKQLELVEEVIGSVIERFSKNFSTRNIEVQVPDEPIYVPMEAKLIEQVLFNILDNAHKHTADNDIIKLSVRKAETADGIIFSIVNFGPSVSREDLPHIFELFYTSQLVSKGKSNIGLGLPICQAIINAHGGTIQIRNIEEEKGVEVTFTLPLEDVSNE